MNSSGVASPTYSLQIFTKKFDFDRIFTKISTVSPLNNEKNQFLATPLTNSAINHTFYYVVLLYLLLCALVRGFTYFRHFDVGPRRRNSPAPPLSASTDSGEVQVFAHPSVKRGLPLAPELMAG
jgi:hypothetical protein